MEKIKVIIEQLRSFAIEKYDAFQADPSKGILQLVVIVIAVGLVIILGLMSGWFLEFQKNRRMEKKGVLMEILVKKTTSAKNTEALIRNIHSTLLNTKLREMMYGRPYMSFEIAAEKDKITFYVWTPKDYAEVLTERIYSSYSECAIRVVDDYLEKRIWATTGDYIKYFVGLITGKKIKKPSNHRSIYGTEMELAYHHVLNLNKQVEGEDIISSIISSMKNLEWHEQVVMQVLVRPVNGSWQAKGRKVLEAYVQDGKRPNKRGGTSNNEFKEQMRNEFNEILQGELSELNLGTMAKPTSRKTPYDRKEISGATEKILDAGCETIIRLATIGNYRKKSKTRLKILGAAFNELDRENKLTRKIIYTKKLFYKRLKNRRVYIKDHSNILTPGELSKFFIRLPGEELIDEYPEIQALVVKEYAPPRDVETKKLLIGKNTYRGVDTMIGMKNNDLKRHIIVQGKTGTGKSEWAKGLMSQAMKDGLGFALFEPHGKLAEEVMQIIPENRRKDVVLFDLFDDYPPAFNFCKVKEVHGRKQDELVEKTTKEIIDINKRLFSEAWSGKNAYYLENAIKTVIELKGGNYVDIRRLFSDAAFREHAINNIRDPQLKHFWREEFKLDKKGNLPAATQSTVNSVDYKLGSFLNSKSLLRAVGQDDCIDFKDILDNNKILIFRFNKERMSEDQIRFIGGIAMKLMIVEAFRRDKKQWDTPFLVFMDEAQNFVDTNIKTVLYELRKYGLSLIMMHQVLEQMNEVKGLVDAIYGNVGTILSFTAGEPDAPFFEKVFNPRIDTKDITRLPSRYGYCKLMVDGKTSEAFNIYSLDNEVVDINEARKSYKEILKLNREGKPDYKEIDKMIAARIVGSLDEIEEDHYEDLTTEPLSGWADPIAAAAEKNEESFTGVTTDQEVDDFFRGTGFEDENFVPMFTSEQEYDEDDGVETVIVEEYDEDDDYEGPEIFSEKESSNQKPVASAKTHQEDEEDLFSKL